MKVLVCVPHYFGRTEEFADLPLGSSTTPRAQRERVFRQAVESLVSLLSPRLLLGTSASSSVANDTLEQIDHPLSGEIIICTVGDHHLCGALPPAPMIRGVKSKEHPALLGYSCRQIFAERAGDFDLYCFIEDDVAIDDPEFFTKVVSFYETCGEAPALLPNRYEIFLAAEQSAKVYLEGPSRPDRALAPRPEWQRTLVDHGVEFTLAERPFGMCYVLTRNQLLWWMRQRDFLSFDAPLKGRMDPMEAAQIPFGGTRPIYKPSLKNPAYLEVHHLMARACMAQTPGRKILELFPTPRSR